MPEILTARQPATVPVRQVELTHWIEWDTRKLGDQQRALCGLLVQSRSFAPQPTCPECRAQLVALDNMEF